MADRHIALVTGGSAGIGAEIVKELLAADYEVISLARRLPALSHPRLHGLEVDLFDAKATREIAREIAQRWPLTHVIHNAGVIRPAVLGQVGENDLAELAQIHLNAAITLVEAALPGMRERRFGRVILMSSRAAQGVPTRTAYSATKAGMIGMARTWALELAADGITVNVVAPGPIGDTEMFREVIPENSEREKALANAIPVKRLGRSDDVSRAVMFFADPRNSFVTGQALFVCGGSSVGTITL